MNCQTRAGLGPIFEAFAGLNSKACANYTFHLLPRYNDFGVVARRGRTNVAETLHYHMTAD